MAFEDMEYSALVYEPFLRCFPFTVLKNNTFPFILLLLEDYQKFEVRKNFMLKGFNTLFSKDALKAT